MPFKDAFKRTEYHKSYNSSHREQKTRTMQRIRRTQKYRNVVNPVQSVVNPVVNPNDDVTVVYDED